MKYFGTQTYYLLDKSKPYQRPELRHAGPNDVNREAELRAPSRVACSDLLDHIVIWFLKEPNVALHWSAGDTYFPLGVAYCSTLLHGMLSLLDTILRSPALTYWFG